MKPVLCLALIMGLGVLPPGSPARVPAAEVSGAQQDLASFQDYKRRLLTLVAGFRRYQTTTADIETVFGRRFPVQVDREATPGWIIKALPAYKSLRFYHTIGLYYGVPADATIWRRRLYYEVQYRADFERDTRFEASTDRSPVVSDAKTCLTLGELKRALTQRGEGFSAPQAGVDPGTFFVDADRHLPLEAGEIGVFAFVRPFHYGAKAVMDMSDGCVTIIGIH